MHCDLDTPIRAHTGTPLQSPAAQSHVNPPPAARSISRQPARRAESARLGIRCHGQSMQPAALRVLETTWRVWREPLA